MPEQSLLLDSISFSYDPDGPEPLHGLSGAIPLSGVSLVLGQNASGKTTLGRIIAGLDSPSSGQMVWPPLRAKPVGSWSRPQASVIFEEPEYQLQTFEVGEELSIGLLHCGATPEERSERVLETAQVLELQNSLDRPVDELTSGGKLGLLAAAMVTMSPRLIVLDFSPSRLEPSLRNLLFTLARGGEGPALLFMGREAVDLLFLTPGERAYFLHGGFLKEIESIPPGPEQLSALEAAGLALPWYAPLTLELYRRGKLERILFPDDCSLREALGKSCGDVRTVEIASESDRGSPDI